MLETQNMIGTIIVLFIAVTGVLGGEKGYCLSNNGGDPLYHYCSYGCCCSDVVVSKPEYCCCPGSGEGLLIFTITGCVVGGILFLAGIITVICCCIRHKGESGQVFRSDLEGLPGPFVYAPEMSPVYQSSDGEIYQPQPLVPCPPPYTETEGSQPNEPEAPPAYEEKIDK